MGGASAVETSLSMSMIISGNSRGRFRPRSMLYPAIISATLQRYAESVRYMFYETTHYVDVATIDACAEPILYGVEWTDSTCPSSCADWVSFGRLGVFGGDTTLRGLRATEPTPGELRERDDLLRVDDLVRGAI
jgi:hypothetical protein